ncbi:MAG: PAS domain S-box protein [Acidobacteriota bacterium]
MAVHDIARSDDALIATDLHVEATYRLTEALVASENQMRRRVDLLSEVVFETDADHRLVYLNSAWSKTTGVPIADALGQTVCHFIVDDDCDAARTWMHGIARGERAEQARLRVRFQHAAGHQLWADMSASVLPEGGVVGAIRDVTAERQAQEEIEKLSLVASNTDNLVVITDAEGYTEWVNQAFIKRTGYTMKDLRGKKPGHLLQGPDTDPASVDQIRAWRKEGRSFRITLLNYTRSGEPFWALFQITPIRDASGAVQRFVSIQTDVTELRRARAELEAAKERAEAASEAKTQFLATMSHEMRTPLNVILGSTDIALVGDEDPDAMRGHLTRINSSADMLLRLITDMLDVSKIEAGQFDFEHIPVKLRQCLNAALAPIAERARAKGLAFRVMVDEALPTQILGDPDRLQQIVTNLAGNALKFTDTGGICVEALHLDRGPLGRAGLEIRVTDSGPGIALDAQARIFQRFEQADSSTTRRKGGVGLGLNIVKSLVEALSGTVTVQSTPGAGATFSVVLPMEVAPQSFADEATARAIAIAGASAGAGAGARVLVAEDTDANFAVLEIYLTKAGYTVRRAVNGVEAVNAASDVDLILMDVEMPDIDGLEATRRIRAAEQDQRRVAVPILALTAHAVHGYRERCLSAGCTGYLSKPIRRPNLLSAVRAALDEARHIETPVAPTASAPVRTNAVDVDAELAHLVPAFLEHCRREEARVRHAITTRDWESAVRAGHSLKGSAPSIGFNDIGRLGLDIETAATARCADRALIALDQLRTHLEDVTAVALPT